MKFQTDTLIRQKKKRKKEEEWNVCKCVQRVVLAGKEEANLKLSNGSFSFFNKLQVLLCYGHVFCLNGGLTPVIITAHTHAECFQLQCFYS